MEDINAVHVDDNDVNIHHISVAHDIETHVQVTHVQADTCSFTDGSSLFIGQIFSSKTEVKKLENLDFKTGELNRFCDLTGMRKRHRQASSSVVCDMLVENFQGQQKTPQPKSIMTMMRNEGVDITYYKALKGKQLAHDIFRGDPERSFGLLPSYLKIVERMNPGGIIELVVDEHNRFKCMRKVVSIDGTWLKGKYDGTLLVALAQDGDFHPCPLVWAVVNVESIASWSWFLTKLLEVVVDEEELKEGLYRSVYAVNENYKQIDFDLEYEMFKKIYPNGATFLDESDSLDQWTRAYSPRSGYNIMTTNDVESINARLCEERQLPIIALLNSLQTLTASWFSRYRRNASIASTANFTPTIESIMHERFNIRSRISRL
ncbi:uncharacterized protein LOC142509635 [Primulina tabacum]|uniref:uncharacterized protein LOC142509635 n=1 Tax=Primulina tabacum TaxID=48773 RepID=UPI003F5949BF